MGPALSDDPFTGQPIQYVDKISGCAMLFDLRKVQSVGFFDENIFLFFEENDLCLRIIQAGLRIGLCRQIRIQHLSGKASPMTPQIEYLKNWHYGWSYSCFVDKHGVDAKRQTVRKRYWRYRFKSWLSLRPIKRLHYRAKADGVRAFIRGESAFTAALRESDIRPSRKSLRPRTNDA